MFSEALHGITTGAFGFASGVVFVEAMLLCRQHTQRRAVMREAHKALRPTAAQPRHRALRAQDHAAA